jgi:hypothetical protein
MTNRQVEFILKMRDEATAKWETFKSKVTSGISSLKSLFGEFGGLLAGIGIEEFIRRSIEASNEAETANTRLASALKAAGIYSDTLLSQMQRLGGQFQKTTRFEDDAVSSAQAFLVTATGLAGTALEPLIGAVADYAVAMNIGIEEAAKLIGRSVGAGTAIRGLAVDYGNATTPMERAAILQETLNKRFRGFAEEDGKTAATRITQVGNAWGDFLETTGDSLKGIIVAISPVIEFVLKALQGVVYFISSGVAQMVNLLTSVGGHLAWLLEKVGLESKDKVEWYKKTAQDAANKAAEYVAKGYEVWGLAAEDAGKKISATGKRANDSTDEAAENSDKLLKKLMEISALKPAEFVSSEQMQRLDAMEKHAKNITTFLAQSSADRSKSIAGIFIENDRNRKTLEPIKGPDVISNSAFTRLNEFERRWVEMQDSGKNAARIIWSAFDSGVSSMVNAFFDGTQSMAEAFANLTKSVLADLTSMILKSLILRFVTGTLGLGILGGDLGEEAVPEYDTSNFGKRAVLSGPSSAGGGSSIVINALDASSFSSFLGKTGNRTALMNAIRDAVGKEKTR